MVRNHLAHQTNACARSSLRFSLFSAVLLLVANVSLFAPYVVYRSNPEEFEVGFIDMLGQMLWLDIGILTVILLPGMLVSTALRARLIGAVFALGLLTWLQSSVLLWDYGVFDGREVDWSGMDWLGWLDIAIWSVALVAAIRFSAKLLPAVNTTVWVLIVGQLIVLIVERPSVPGYWQRTPVLSWPEALGDLSALEAASDYLLRVGLAGREGVIAAELSHGERRRLELAMVLALKPAVFLLDEPMAGLGPEGTGEIRSLLQDLRKEAPMLLVEHDMDAVFALADRISVLVYGKVIASGTPDEIKSNSAVREAYLGDDI